MADRAQHIAAFLADAGWAGADRRPLAGDASFRRYERLSLGGRRAVLMDAPPPHEDVAAFHRVEDILLSLGLSAPRPLAVNRDDGLMLLEDLGDRTFTRALAEGADERALYELAVDVLVHLHRAADPRALAAAPLPDYDDDRLLQEALLLTDWYLPALRGSETPAAARDAYIEAWRAVFPLARRIPATLVLRDYHVDNLMVLDGRPGVAGCGLLDFQDAVIGPRSYDLVSLLEDARRDIPTDLVAEMLARYFAAFPDIDPAAFRASYAILGAQRSAKI
ncbi:MAG: phosphotransferase, partial [Kiloniellales bacterium]|nr:phosphotransferase [Kiloniellales bacterium]